jgi:beta-xylosidase
VHWGAFKTLAVKGRPMRNPVLVLLCAGAAAALMAQSASKVWVADDGKGGYRNPILYADYSDPDVIRVGTDYYLTASSFDAVPGLPILHSRDLVNWELIGHVYAAQPPLEVFSKVQHGNGAWAPSIRYHAGEFFIFYPDPDFGIYMVKAKDPRGPWSEPLLIKRAKGWIDPCPLWDDDGQAYLVSAFAASRSGVKSVLAVSRLSPDGTAVRDGGAIVFDGHAEDPTVEGPKFYKRNGYYYIFAPAGGVATGWQLALRSRSIYGPYERRVVLRQGHSTVNGPHQGGWVDTPGGEFWFVHFQDAGPYGRIVHLQPMKWVDDWPVIGDNGMPVASHRKPEVGRQYPITTPPDSDEFNAPRIGLQWQWQANPQPNWAFPSAALGVLRLLCIPLPEGARNLWEAPNVLLQKFPGPKFAATAKVKFTASADGDETGLVVMGSDYAYIGIRKKGDALMVVQAVAQNADRGAEETAAAIVTAPGPSVYLRVAVGEGAKCRFSYSRDGIEFEPVGALFSAKGGRWIGAKIGLFAHGAAHSRESGYADFDWFHVE